MVPRPCPPPTPPVGASHDSPSPPAPPLWAHPLSLPPFMGGTEGGPVPPNRHRQSTSTLPSSPSPQGKHLNPLPLLGETERGRAPLGARAPAGRPSPSQPPPPINARHRPLDTPPPERYHQLRTYVCGRETRSMPCGRVGDRANCPGVSEALAGGGEDYRRFQTGGRFSAKARGPSRRSSVSARAAQ